MLRFKLYLLKRRIIMLFKKLSKTTILNKFFDLVKDILNLTIDIIKIAIVIYILISIIFLFILPKTGRVSFKSSNSNSRFFITAKSSTITINDNIPLKYEFFNLVINLEEIEGVEIAGNYFNKNDYQDMELHVDAINDDLMGSLSISFDNRNELYLESINDNVEVWYNIQGIQEILKSGFKIKYNGTLNLTFNDCNSYLLLNKKEKIYTNTISVINKRKLSELNFSTPNYSLLYVTPDNLENINKNISIRDISQLNGYLTGKLLFYYSLEPKIFNINNQTIEMYSDNSELESNMSIVDNDVSFDTNGIVNKANISYFNLFPSLNNWIRSDPYSVIAYVITTIFGGITLFKRRK